MDFPPFDRRGYRTLAVRDGYCEWAPAYDAVVPDRMDLGLLARLEMVDWAGVRQALDLGCGTGRIGA